MRVLHVSKIKGIAGSERHLLTLLPGLARAGVDLSMLVLEEPGTPADDFCEAVAAQGIPADRLTITGHIDPSLLNSLTATIKAARPDIVHTHLLHADLYGQLAARRAGVPHTLSSRHNDNPFRRNPILKMMNRLAMRRADRLIVISGALAEFATQVEGIPPERVVTVRYGLEPLTYPPGQRERVRAEWNIPADAPLVGFFGRLVDQKGVDVLLRAWGGLQEDYPAARLVIVGDGVLRAELESLADALGVCGSVIFAGWQSDASLLMPACDVLTMPSRWEGFGLVALETMSAARPLVASRVSALPEIVDDLHTGLLVPPGDPDALAEAIGGLLADPAWASALGQAGYQRLVDVFAVDKMVQATLDVYQSVVGGDRQ